MRQRPIVYSVYKKNRKENELVFFKNNLLC